MEGSEKLDVEGAVPAVLVHQVHMVVQWFVPVAEEQPE